jgi:glycosyltransferase involved in cell wall biosynthesis
MENQKLSVTIITKNEEKNIERCLNSLDWADEIVVVDTNSTDNTVKICREYNCKVLETEWKGFGLTKKYAVDNATYDWIFSIDADEEVTEKLKEKIVDVLRTPSPRHNAYKVKRESFYLGKKINYAGWNKDYPLRFFNRRYGNFNDKIVHESVEVQGELGKIEAPLLHYTYPTLKSHLSKINRYGELDAKKKFDRNKKASIGKALLASLIKFIKMYIFQKGFLDGKIGFVLCLNSAFGVYIKYMFLWEKTR